MKIANGNVISMAPAQPGWTVAIDLGGSEPEPPCPLVGWATVIQTHLKDGTTTTVIEPAFLWGQQVWIETDLREHAPDKVVLDIRPPATA